MASNLRPDLPVDALAPGLAGALRHGRNLVLSAPTGSGKSTRVPRMLADLVGGARILVLQPRRIAARMLARRVAEEAGCELGGEVGYHIRFDRRFGASTRILFLTEGILPRMLAADPMLPGVRAIVFDEFHERHLQTDLGLALALDLRRAARPDLTLCVMSATLDIDPVVRALDPCDVLESASRAFPVEISHHGGAADARRPSGRPPAVWDLAADAFRRLARGGAPDGHTLVFMPGAFEINRTMTALRALREARGHRVLALHGGLPPAEQDAAVEPSVEPKIIVATNVAETSLTIDGVTTVIDSGQARLARFDPRRGIDTLLVERIAMDSADQRAGRAGRTAPGRCVRLWPESENTRRPAHGLPEIHRVDLAECLLLLRTLGHSDVRSIPWIEPPDERMVAHADDLLKDLGALTPDGEITDRGRQLARFPVHPRIALLLIEGGRRGCPGAAARTAAMLQGRPLLKPNPDKAVGIARDKVIARVRSPDAPASDILDTLALWSQARDSRYDADFCHEIGLSAGAAREADRLAASLADLLDHAADKRRRPASACDPTESALLEALTLAFSDHLAVRDSRGTLRCSIARGRRGELRRSSRARDATLLVACEIGESGRVGDTTVFLGMASEVRREWLDTLFPGETREVNETVWDDQRREAVGQLTIRFRDLVLDRRPTAQPDPAAAEAMLTARVLDGALKLNAWNAEVDQLIERINFLAKAVPDLGLSPVDDDGRRLILAQVCEGATAYREIKNRPVLPVVRSWLTPAQRDLLDKAAPATIALPGRKRPHRIRYEAAAGRAVVSGRLQEFLGVPHTELTIALGRIPLTVELLAPNGRPVQTTNDLDAFWSTSYPAIRKELRGRYPKHDWPETP